MREPNKPKHDIFTAQGQFDLMKHLMDKHKPHQLPLHELIPGDVREKVQKGERGKYWEHKPLRNDLDAAIAEAHFNDLADSKGNNHTREGMLKRILDSRLSEEELSQALRSQLITMSNRHNLSWDEAKSHLAEILEEIQRRNSLAMKATVKLRGSEELRRVDELVQLNASDAFGHRLMSLSPEFARDKLRELKY